MGSYFSPEKAERLRVRSKNEGAEQCARELCEIALTGAQKKQYSSPTVQDAAAHIMHLHEKIRTLHERIQMLQDQRWLYRKGRKTF